MEELSVHEIEARAKESSNENLPFRFLPTEIIKTASSHLQKTGDIERIIKYILNSFYIYRESVCMSFFAPHYKINGVFEWPSPAKFSWSNIEAVILGGEFVYGKIFEEKTEIKVETREQDKVKVISIDPKTNIKEETIREIIEGKDDLYKKLKYKIEDMSKVNFLLQNLWQNDSLKTYANPLYFFLKNYLEGKIEKKEARKNLEVMFKNLEDYYIG